MSNGISESVLLLNAANDCYYQVQRVYLLFVWDYWDFASQQPTKSYQILNALSLL
jgi:hypothetical protein